MASNTRVTFKRVEIGRVVDLLDDTRTPSPAYEFGQGKTIFQKPQIPGQPYTNRLIREKDVDPSLR